MIKKINREKLSNEINKRRRLENKTLLSNNETIRNKDQECIQITDEVKRETENRSVVNLGEEREKSKSTNKYEIKNYYSNGEYVYVKSADKPTPTRISRHMWIKENLYNIDESTHESLLEFLTRNGISELLVSREQYLNKHNLMKLQINGLDVIHSNANIVTEFLRDCEWETPIRNIHSKLGFMEHKGKLIYKLYEAIGVDSTYVGSYEIKPQGSEYKFIDMIKTQVLGNVELEFALISGLSAILLGYIGEDLGLDSTIIHITGNSTTGKSTALKLAISCFGCPNAKSNGLYGTYNGTDNALIKKLGGLKGIPYAFDEISMSDNNNFTRFIYSLANGADKERLDKNSELKDKEFWLTTILSNGEKSITRASNKNAGVQVRVIEAENFNWTKSAENAEAINHIILNNYGHLGMKFAKYLLKQSKEVLIQQHRETKSELYDEFQEKELIDGMSMRRCGKFSILIQTALILEEILDIEMNIEGIVGMIAKIEAESLKSRNFKKSVIEFIKEYVDRYRNKFESPLGTKSLEVLGTLKEKDDYVEVQMERISFKSMISEGRFEDEKVVLKELKDGGYLDCEGDRYTRRRKNSVGCKTDFIVIKLYK